MNIQLHKLDPDVSAHQLAPSPSEIRLARLARSVYALNPVAPTGWVLTVNNAN